MAGRPKYSIVMPCYNHGRFVGAAIESILAQTVADWELLVVDDGSSDNSPEVIQDFARRDPRIKFHRQKNAGQSVARNAAIAQAAGPWIAFIDSDDLWLPQALELFDRYMAANSQTKFIHGRRQQLNEDGTITACPPQFQDRPTGTVELFGRMFITQSCVCCRRELFGPDQAGVYDPALRVCEDYDLLLRMSLYCRFDPLGEVTSARRRRHGTNISTQSGYTRMYEAMVLKRFAQRFGAKVQPGARDATLPPSVVKPRLRQLYYAAGRQYFRHRGYTQAIGAVLRSFRYGISPKQLLLSTGALLLLPLNRRDPKTPPKI
jgi:glycosyltransferase involved in cell wall biosynthesis